MFDDDGVPKPPASQRVLASDAKARIACGEFVPDDELTQLGLGRAFRSAKGEVLRTWPGRKFALLSEREALRSWWIALNAHAAANGGGRSVAADLPGGQHFVEQIPMLLEELPALLGVDPKRLDYSLASMRAVDAAITRRRRERTLVKRLFAAVVAYVGEIVRRHVGGTWRMWQPEEHWAPLVARPDGLTFDPLEISKPWVERQPLATTVWFASEGMGAWHDHEAEARRPRPRTGTPAACRYPPTVSRRTPVASTMRRSDQPRRPSATTCRCFVGSKTFPMTTQTAEGARSRSTSQRPASGNGRFWGADQWPDRVSTEEVQPRAVRWGELDVKPRQPEDTRGTANVTSPASRVRVAGASRSHAG